MKYTHKYGKCPEDPVNLNSIPASIIFMNSLITPEGCHIIYHRPGSAPFNNTIIDHYEIMTSDYRYDDILINVYNEKSTWIPPEGYMFDKMSVEMQLQLEKRVFPEIPGDEDRIDFDMKYFFPEEGFNDKFYCYPMALLIRRKPAPAPYNWLHVSYGTNSFVENFPYQVIMEYFFEMTERKPEAVEKFLSDVRPRTAVDENEAETNSGNH